MLLGKRGDGGLSRPPPLLCSRILAENPLPMEAVPPEGAHLCIRCVGGFTVNTPNCVGTRFVEGSGELRGNPSWVTLTASGHGTVVGLGMRPAALRATRRLRTAGTCRMTPPPAMLTVGEARIGARALDWT